MLSSSSAIKLCSMWRQGLVGIGMVGLVVSFGLKFGGYVGGEYGEEYHAGGCEEYG